MNLNDQETGAWPSMTGNLLEEHTHDGKISAEDEADIRGAAATIYSGEYFFAGLMGPARRDHIDVKFELC